MNDILNWFEKTCSNYPDKIAFIDPHKRITWGELKNKSIYSACCLTDKIKPNSSVAFFMEKNVDAVCAMIGTIYAGCFYSFIDIRQPSPRITKMIETLKPKVVITDDQNYSRALELFYDFDRNRIIILSDLVENPLCGREISCDLNEIQKRRDNCTDTSPLYVNFTSGSTGIPKGVAVSSLSVVDFIEHFVSIFEISSSDVLANQAPFDFDVSVKDIYSAIKTGATVILIPRDYFTNPTLLMDYICDMDTTVMIWAVSAMCFVSGMSCFKYRIPDKLRMVIFSGEVMPIKQLLVWKKYLPNVKYVNVYGPTEITCNCTYYVIPKGLSVDDRIPVGKPFPNEKVFLLDENNELISAENNDKVGEICVAGSCLALGYYGDEEKTNEKFVQNPLNRIYREMIYRTGDLGYYDEYEQLHYAGRIDNQIKVNGHRIELSDIERNAEKIDKVDRTCCLYNKGKIQLIMYYVGSAVSSDIRTNLKKVLPEYMIPNKIIQLDAFPMNKNGKIDRKMLGEMAYDK